MTVNLVVPTADEGGFPLLVPVSPSGADYTGSARAKFAKCEGTQTTGTIKLTLVPDTSEISNGHWGRWTGTVVATAPYVDLGNGSYCPSGSWDFKVSSGSTGSAGTAGSTV